MTYFVNVSSNAIRVRSKAHVTVRTEICQCEWCFHCEHICLLAMVTFSYLCKQQRIRRQGYSDPSYCSSKSDIAMNCDQAAVRTNSTRDGAFEQSVTTCWEAKRTEHAGQICLTLCGRRACRSERRGAAELLKNHTTLHHTKKQPAPN